MATEKADEVVDAEVSEARTVEPPILLDADFQRKLFQVPDDLEFPLEIGYNLKGKLHSVLEQNWHLKRHLDYLDKEVIDLRKYRVEHREICQQRAQISECSNSTSNLMTQRIVELSKKNRDLTSQTEMMKTKINKMHRENESLRNMVECFKEKETQEELQQELSIKSDCNNNEDQRSTAVSLTTPGSHQLAQLTNKVIEYRRQNQLLKMELKTALRALSQEVGDGATPQGVLGTVSGYGSSWRGRQQQILGLQQKVLELQLKLRDATAAAATQILGDPELFSMANPMGSGDGKNFPLIAIDQKIGNGSQSMLSNTSIPQRAGLVQQGKKRQEHIDKLTHDLEQTTKDLKSCQQELKANKARIHTLENHVRTYKNHVEILEGKLNEAERESEATNKEMKQLRLELVTQRDRERKYRDEMALEIQEAQRALQRERAIVMRLQSVIEEKQDAIQRHDSTIIELRNKLEISCSGAIAGGISTIDRMQEMENQLEQATKALKAGEEERQSLLKMMQEYLKQSEEERQKCVQAAEHTAKISCVLQRADHCINECLDAGQVTNEEVLTEVEHIKSLVRELKLGDLYIFENLLQNKASPKKLQIQVEMLKREISGLKSKLTEVSNMRQKELQNFSAVTDQLKSDWAEALSIKQTAATKFVPIKKASKTVI